MIFMRMSGTYKIILVLCVMTYICIVILTKLNERPRKYYPYLIDTTEQSRQIKVTIYTEKDSPEYHETGLHLLMPLIVPGKIKPRFDELMSPPYRSPFNLSTPVDTMKVALRQDEIINCLRQNLYNTAVATITLFYLDQHLPEYIEKLNLQNSYKLRFVNQPKDPTVKVELAYANNHLTNKVVMLVNPDIVLCPKTSHLIEIDKFLKVDTMYSLTRRLPENPCKQLKLSSNCNNMRYIGSNDAFIFSWKNKINTSYLDELDFGQNVLGMENVLMWVFQNRLKFKVINPCKVIHIYHHHCVNTRHAGNSEKYRVNRLKVGNDPSKWKSYKSGEAPYTSSLW